MNYKLAKELKDAGFPVDIIVDKTPEDELCEACKNGYYGECYGNCQYKRYPTLSELIEACGDEIEAPNLNTKEKKPIAHLFRLGKGDEWYATYEFYESYIDNGFGLPVIGYGKTPEASVARLWLALNEK